MQRLDPSFFLMLRREGLRDARVGLAWHCFQLTAIRNLIDLNIYLMVVATYVGLEHQVALSSI